MDIRQIKSAADYRETLSEIESLMTARAKSHEGDRLNTLVALVEAYEHKHFPSGCSEFREEGTPPSH